MAKDEYQDYTEADSEGHVDKCIRFPPILLVLVS